MSARVICVIVTELERRGNGTQHDPVRRVKQYWSLDGTLLAEADPCSDTLRAFTEPPPPTPPYVAPR